MHYLIARPASTRAAPALPRPRRMQTAFARVGARERRDEGAGRLGVRRWPDAPEQRHGRDQRSDRQGHHSTDGPYVETEEMLGGFWVLEIAPTSTRR